ncbi:NGFI-A-binding protein 1-like isoform X3 [Limulus polyphemus]|uniref:NGFI-A-binding protein 1-like isoform X3 n=1 Tax=Limulus polyphemus TaxID=6850 RepID=A0ABM1SCJ6_LIMPO|nr:NGFI-A-binding protein 1-like isoform X3 [Limulus polyphemus]
MTYISSSYMDCSSTITITTLFVAKVWGRVQSKSSVCTQEIKAVVAATHGPCERRCRDLFLPFCATPPMEQVRELMNHCAVPSTSDTTATTGPGPGPTGPPPPPLVPTGYLGNRMMSRNVNGTIAMTSQPTNESELQLYRVLQRANLLSYYDTFICQGGDDVQQLCEAGEEEFLEIMALVGMASKPLHVRRLQKALQEWVNNPAMFQTPLVPALPPNHPSHLLNSLTASGRVGPGPGAPANLSQSTGLPMRPSPPVSMLPNNSSHSSPSPGRKDVTSPSQTHVATQHHQQQLQQFSQLQQQHQIIQSFQQGSGEYGQPGSPISLTPILDENQIQRLAEAAEILIKTMPPLEPKLQNNKKKISKELEYAMSMPEDDPRRMDEMRKYAAIYGRFDCKRKPEKPLTLHEVSVNEAAAQICKHIPALLTRRDELFPLARQVVRDSGYQYSKGHSSFDDTSRSQGYRSYEEDSCKRPRLDPSPYSLIDKTQLEEEKKKRQERYEAIADQLKSIGAQQEDLKAKLLQSQELQNYSGVNQIQPQLEQLSKQHVQLINEQSELNKQLKRLDRYLSSRKGYGHLSNCSESEKIDTDDTDSQFSAYSNTSSPPMSQEVNDSTSLDFNHSITTTDMFSAMRMMSTSKKTNAQITKQLVQETLMDEGLRVVKELANQIKDENESSVTLSKVDILSQAHISKAEKDYVNHSSASTSLPSAVTTSSSISSTTRSSTTPLVVSPPAQNCYGLVSLNGPV